MEKGAKVLAFLDEEDKDGVIGFYIKEAGDKAVIQVGDTKRQFAKRGAEDAARDGQGLTYRPL